ncbi:hypothetical protein EAI_00455 [Harpegnathos saltator]|uniref:Uncharacterized protein n=1 Tax=Harpegnathos saltator TaxID=610380 RepID=E2BKA4_HARSA|nr:hypothetical protein EAI_00455 [Harpegnathos saltator]
MEVYDLKAISASSHSASVVHYFDRFDPEFHQTTSSRRNIARRNTRTKKRTRSSGKKDGMVRGKEGDEGTGGERERWKEESVEDERPDQRVRVGHPGVAWHARTAEGAAGMRVVNPLGEGESEFAALNMVDSRIGCAVAGRCGPHHRPAGRTIPVAVYEPSRGVPKVEEMNSELFEMCFIGANLFSLENNLWIPTKLETIACVRNVNQMIDTYSNIDIIKEMFAIRKRKEDLYQQKLHLQNYRYSLMVALITMTRVMKSCKVHTKDNRSWPDGRIR